jgi:hypothetical protein
LQVDEAGEYRWAEANLIDCQRWWLSCSIFKVIA